MAYPQPFPDGSIAHQVVKAAKLNLSAPAVRGPQRPDGSHREITYAQLLANAYSVARHLEESDDFKPQRDAFVAVLLPRDIEFITAVLGVFFSGAAYLPLSSALPKDRIRFMIGDSEARILLTDAKGEALTESWFFYRTLLISDIQRVDEPAMAEACVPLLHLNVSPSDLAYMIYTSGTTGTPKGVEVEHRGIVNLLHHHRKNLLRPHDCGKAVVVAAFIFDSHVREVWLPLSLGGCLCIAENVLSLTEGTMTAGTPAGLAVAAVPRSIRTVLVGGEALTTQTVESVSPQATAIYNVYGPTECSVECTVHSTNPAKPHKIARIGKPIWNVHLYGVTVGGDSPVDGVPTLAPIGESCELWIGGVGVARGYHNRPDLNQKSFLPNPFGQEGRVYRTGDLVRWTTSGILEHLGRIDSQVKLRGYRIELGEVEAVTSGTPGVQQCAVLLKHGPDNQDHLVAYVTPPIERSLVLAHCSSRLARYMTPNIVVGVEAFPIAAGGKVDRRALPAPDWGLYNILSRAGSEKEDVSLTKRELTVRPKTAHTMKIRTVTNANSVDESVDGAVELTPTFSAVTSAQELESKPSVLVGLETATSFAAPDAPRAASASLTTMESSSRILDAVCYMNGANRAAVYGHSNFFSEL